MSDHTYRLIEIAGTSTEGVSQAIANGVDRAAATLRGLDWFEVTSIRGFVDNDTVQHFQVQMKVGFRLEDKVD
ncbi:dodecin [uncultured Jatrophihabitans sp.]|uniref:dodecin n=1 Tax=uncultured Jatrophihabitans sp. TaxID=1610747 RepID=UPI0035CCA45F